MIRTSRLGRDASFGRSTRARPVQRNVAKRVLIALCALLVGLLFAYAYGVVMVNVWPRARHDLPLITRNPNLAITVGRDWLGRVYTLDVRNEALSEWSTEYPRDYESFPDHQQLTHEQLSTLLRLGWLHPEDVLTKHAIRFEVYGWPVGAVRIFWWTDRFTKDRTKQTGGSPRIWLVPFLQQAGGDPILLPLDVRFGALLVNGAVFAVPVYGAIKFPWAIGVWRRRSRRRGDRCAACAHELAGLATCPECATLVAAPVGRSERAMNVVFGAIERSASAIWSVTGGPLVFAWCWSPAPGASAGVRALAWVRTLVFAALGCVVAAWLAYAIALRL